VVPPVPLVPPAAPLLPAVPEVSPAPLPLVPPPVVPLPVLPVPPGVWVAPLWPPASEVPASWRQAPSKPPTIAAASKTLVVFASVVMMIPFNVGGVSFLMGSGDYDT
jgi:hypothetical protein